MPVFRVLSGVHCEGERGADGKLIKYRRGDIFKSKSNLDKSHNQPMSIRFEKLPDDTPLTHPEVPQAAAAGFNTAFTDSNQPTPDAQKIFDDLSKMDVPNLIKFAAEEEIDLGNLKKKDEIIAQIKRSMLPSPAKA